jgi:hypothetical protein
MPNFVPKSAGPVCCCALVAGMCAAGEVDGQERAVPSAGATLQASATIMPSIDAASFAVLAGELPRSWNDQGGRSGALLVTVRRPTDGATDLAALADPPLARSFERVSVDGRSTVRHTLAVLY